MGICEFAYVARIELGTSQHRIAQRLGQIAHRLPIGLGGKGAHIDIVVFGQRQQHARGHRALVALQQCQIAR